MEHIFWAETKKEKYFLAADEISHMQVLRMSLPATILFSCGDGKLYRGKACEDGTIADAEVVETAGKTGIGIYFGVCDKNRISYILEKCTELGVDSFTPLFTEKSEKHPLNRERASRIIISALKQSRRFTMPEYREPINLKDLEIGKGEDAVFGSIGCGSGRIGGCGGKVSLIIGPPLGFTEKEESVLMEKGAKPFHFDTGILRTETFAVSLLSIIHYIKGAKNG